ncbi:hypothetical protein NitYY0826_C0448 [Nitratiruptor sp. YY08-26]|uniref:hypothetical protein n=1 Tax=unclassified Nitratiruptor TaxID=2624044 RepID=UPI001915F336|nr:MULTISPECIES: hypothetical protein [unclassified Nitratiruptor]BCD61589.1 hypothetical protein NitYY0813_C0447 [Nitratiruptor sp. YY08-13]BCD65523.1 hypothetical protein NitYY0826_C0448 [Nitratiruptor sp. YY08-26]
MEQLRDIKPLVAIPDYSFYLYIGFIVFVTTLAAVLVYFIIKLLSRKKIDKRKEILERLRSLDLNDPKRVAYEITKYGKYIIRDESNMRLYEDLVRKLTKYKYKKEVPPLSSDIKKEIKLFLRVHDE